MIYNGIIIYRIQFIGQHSFRMGYGIINRPQYLGNTTQGIIFLHLVFKHVVLNVLRVV